MSAIPDPLSYQKYFTHNAGEFENRSEIEMYDNMYGEYAGISGIPIEYYILSIDDYKEGLDVIYGENSRPKWDRKIKIPAILDNFTPEVIAFNPHGLQNDDEITLFVHRSTFDNLVGIRTQKQQNKSVSRRGAFGPVANDQVQTLHNGLIYEVVTGGLHFLSPQEQLFGHKFWYKLTCKVRQTSDASLGEGEQYGAVPDNKLDSKWTGNPQFLLPTPSDDEYNNGTTIVTPSTSSQPSTEYCEGGNYSTIGSQSGVVDSNNVTLPNGGIMDQYKVEGMKENSKFSDKKEIKKTVNDIVDPQTDAVTEEGSIENEKYGPNGRVIPHNRKLWADW